MTSPQRRAVVGAVVFFLILPGVVAGVIPWTIASYEMRSEQPAGWSIIGLPLIAGGLTLVVGACGQFISEGRGVPVPLSSTSEFVVGGLYRFVRNPMYLAVGAIILGQAAVFRSTLVFVYGMAFAAVVYSFVIWYEQPTLSRRYGFQYAEYLRAVPGWWPRRTPWTPTDRVGGA